MKRYLTLLPIFLIGTFIDVNKQCFAQTSSIESIEAVRFQPKKNPSDSLPHLNTVPIQIDSITEKKIKVDSSTKSTDFNPSISIDTLTFFKILAPKPSLFSSTYQVLDNERDFIFHRQLEDYVAFKPNVFLRDKIEFGQVNDLEIGGLNPRYQAIYLDDILLNDVVSGRAIYQQLSTESFSRLNIYNGFAAFVISSSPIVIESHTQTIVAAKGYTKAHYFQSSGSTNKMDITFALNLSERVSLYSGYVREGTEGIFNNSGGFGADRFGSSSEANKLRVHLRYQPAIKTYLNFTFEKNSLNQKPYGGINFNETAEIGGDIFSPLSSIIQNQFFQRSLGLTLYKISLETALPFIPERFHSDSLNTFKAWVAFSQFNHSFQKNRPDLFDTLLISDASQSSRLSIGAKESLKLYVFSVGLRADFYSETVTGGNQLTNSKDELILPNMNSIYLTAAAKTTFDKLIFGQPLIIGASIGWLTKAVTSTRGQDFASTFLSTGFGGEVTLPLSPSGETTLKTFVDVSTTNRLPSLQEVFSNQDIKGAQVWQTERISRLETGTELKYKELIKFRLSLLSTIVNSPYCVVKQILENESSELRYRLLQNNSLTYSGVGATIESRVPTDLGRIETTINTTAILNYTLLSNKDNSFVSGLRVGSDTINAETNRVLYLPRWSVNGGIFLRNKFFDNALDLKIGFAGFVQSELAASYKNSERQPIFYFNLIENNGKLRDNNLQFGTLTAKATLDFQMWAGIKSGMIYFFVENILNTNVFRAPFFPLYQQAFRLGVNWEILD